MLVNRAWVIGIVLLVAASLGALSHFGIQRPLINDEAVELIQGTGATLARFHFLTPPEFYPDGHVDVIETFSPYLSAMLFRGWNGPESQREFIQAVRGCFLLAYAASCGLFAWSIARVSGNTFGFIAGVALAASSAVLIVNNIITRNGLTISWSCAVLASLVAWKGPDVAERRVKSLVAPLLLALALVFGCWTYTSFRLVAAAVYGALAIDWMTRDQSRAGAAKIALSFAVFALVLIALVTANEGSLSLFLNRGGYALGGADGYLRRLLMTLSSPVYYTPSSDYFLTEDVHILVGRAPMSWFLVPFFVWGAVRAWFVPVAIVRIALLTWTIGMFVCALAGPNIKYLIAFYPFALLVAIFGVANCWNWLAQRGVSRRWLTASSVLLFSAFLGTELHHVFRGFASDRRHEMNAAPDKLARRASELATEGETRIYVQPGQGLDIVAWQLRARNLGSIISLHADMSSVRDSLEASAPPPHSVLLIDYPVEAVSLAPNAPTLPLGMVVESVAK